MSFLVSAVRKKKRHQKKKDRSWKISTFYRTNAPDHHGGIFSKIRRSDFWKTQRVFGCGFVEILSLLPPLTRPKSTVGFSKQPKGWFWTAGDICCLITANIVIIRQRVLPAQRLFPKPGGIVYILTTASTTIVRLRVLPAQKVDFEPRFEVFTNALRNDFCLFYLKVI